MKVNGIKKSRTSGGDYKCLQLQKKSRCYRKLINSSTSFMRWKWTAAGHLSLFLHALKKQLGSVPDIEKIPQADPKSIIIWRSITAVVSPTWEDEVRFSACSSQLYHTCAPSCRSFFSVSPPLPPSLLFFLQRRKKHFHTFCRSCFLDSDGQKEHRRSSFIPLVIF